MLKGICEDTYRPEFHEGTGYYLTTIFAYTAHHGTLQMVPYIVELARFHGGRAHRVHADNYSILGILAIELRLEPHEAFSTTSDSSHDIWIHIDYIGMLLLYGASASSSLDLAGNFVPLAGRFHGDCRGMLVNGPQRSTSFNDSPGLTYTVGFHAKLCSCCLLDCYRLVGPTSTGLSKEVSESPWWMVDTSLARRTAKKRQHEISP
eukprot:scaffold4232_cov215-Amphora_coffeaeformis.AAC.9